MSNIPEIANRLKLAYHLANGGWEGVARAAVECACEPKADFESALAQIKLGRAVRRKPWPEGVCVAIARGTSPEEEPYCDVITGSAFRIAHINLYTDDGYGPWVPQAWDLLAEDWENL